MSGWEEGPGAQRTSERWKEKCEQHWGVRKEDLVCPWYEHEPFRAGLRAESRTTACWRDGSTPPILGGPWGTGRTGGGELTACIWTICTHTGLTPKSIPHSDLHLDSVSTWVLFSLGSPAPWTDVPPQQLESFKHGVMLGPLMGLGDCSKAGAL